MPHKPKFYLFSSAKKGEYLLKRGDKEKQNNKIGSAITYYTEALEYCHDEAQERLDKISPLLSPKSINSPTYLNQDSAFHFIDTEQQPQQTKISGPYFPPSRTLSKNSLFSISSSIFTSQESFNYSIHDTPSTSALVNMFKIADEETKKHISNTFDQIIQQYNENSRSKAFIQELATLATIPDQQIFISIVTRLLSVEKNSPTFPETTIHGLAVILTCAPQEIDLSERHGLLVNILERLQFRLENTRTENNNEELLPLLRALSALFDAMLCRKLQHLGRIEVYNPIKDRLTELSSDDSIDPEVSFLARYAIQSLAYIGNDESLAMSIFRRGRLAIGIIVDIKSAVLEFDPSVFGSIYEKIVSMSDFTIKMEWYQGLLFLDCLLANEDLSGFETFILKSKLHSNDNFMQGVCLRLEQVASLNSNFEVVLGAQRLLRDLLFNPEISVQTTARMVLHRMDTGTSMSSFSTLASIDSSTSTISTNFSRQSSKVKFAPVWDKSWYTDDNSYLLKAIQNTTNLESNIRNLDKLLPTNNSIHDVNQALMNHYSNQLTIQRVTGDPLDIEVCYINLAIVEAINQRKEDQKMLKEEQEKFVRMPGYENVSSTNTEKSIPIEDILAKRQLSNGIEEAPKRILIIGRAGVGKTTLCKKLIHTFQKGQWNDRFDSVLWLPLRLLKSYKSRKLEDLLLEKYFTEGAENKGKGLAHQFIKSAEEGRILFILDGLDEYVRGIETESGDPLQCFVKSLLDQPNIIVTTRPYGNDRSLLRDMDLELETVGFSTVNVEQYVKSVFTEPSHSNAVLDFIQQTPLIQGLVNIPIQLDLICFSWDELATSKESVTITQLYQTIVKKLWCSDAIRMRKEIGGRLSSQNLFENIRRGTLESHMSPTVEFLGYLAFRGLKDRHQLVFDNETLKKTEDELYEHRLETNQPELPLDLLEEVKKSSILHKPENEAKSKFGKQVETWNFIHLTFQEYFAATWLSKYFDNTKHKSLDVTQLLDYDDTMDFIRINKYNPRYEIVWWMIAGQLSGTALTTYFEFLQSAPRDLIGSRHQILIAGCLKESNSRLSADLSEQIQAELMQWLRFELSFADMYNGSILGKQSVFPEEILVKSLGESIDHDVLILKALKHHKQLKPSTVKNIVKIIRSTNTNIKEKEPIVQVLGDQPSVSHDPQIAAVTKTLDKHSISPDSTTTALAIALKDSDVNVRQSAAYLLRNQSTLSDSEVTALTIALEDSDPDVRRAAVKALGTQSTLSDSTTMALVTTLQDNHKGIRKAAFKALRNQSFLQDSTISALVTALQNENWKVREAAANTLGKESKLSDSTTIALVMALQDSEDDVRVASVKGLRNQLTLSDSTTVALVTALQHSNWKVRRAAAKSLETQSTMSDFTTTALATALQDSNEDVRLTAATALKNQSTLPDLTATGLVTALLDSNKDVREAAVVALGNQSNFSESITTALITSLQDEQLSVRQAAANALGKQSEILEPATRELVIALQDIGNQSKTSEYTTMKHVTTHQHEHWRARHTSANALGSQSTLSDSATAEFISALQDSNDNVRKKVANTLGSHSSLSDSITIALAMALQDSNKDVRLAVVNALGNQFTLSEATKTALTMTLQDSSKDVRLAAANVLARQPTLSDSTTTAFANAFQDSNWEVRQVAFKVLEHQSILSDCTTKALIGILQHENWDIKHAAADILRKQSTLSDFTTTALIVALNNGDMYVKLEAASILGNKSTLSDSVAIGLVTALQDEDWRVRRAAAKALGNQSKLSDSTTTALVIALQDNHMNVIKAAATALGNQSSLSESTLGAIVALLNVDKIDLISETIGVWEIYSSVKYLAAKEIEHFYKNGLFYHSCKYHGCLFIYKNKLQGYTERGFDESEKLSPEILDGVKKAFLSIQEAGGMSSVDYE